LPVDIVPIDLIMCSVCRHLRGNCGTGLAAAGSPTAEVIDSIVLAAYPNADRLEVSLLVRVVVNNAPSDSSVGA
jgi:hypothetical protein